MDRKGFVSPILLLILILVVIASGIYFYNNKLTSTVRKLQTAPSTTTQQLNDLNREVSTWKPSDTTLNYISNENGISFSYPDNLYISNINIDGSSTLPKLFFDNNTNKYQIDDCVNDCIYIQSFLRVVGDSTKPYYDNEINVQENSKEPFYRYPQYVYPGSSIEVSENGYSIKRYYFAGPQSLDLMAGGKRPNNIKLITGEEAYIADPFVKNRVLVIKYEHVSNPNSIVAKKTTVEKIISSFDESKYTTYTNIVNSLVISDLNKLGTKTLTLENLGLKFTVPRYWGEVTENTETMGMFGPSYAVSFSKTPFTYSSPTNIAFYAQNTNSANFVYESFLGYLSKYAGQNMDSFCKEKGYLNVSESFDIKINSCNTKGNSNGVIVGRIEGRYSVTGAYGRGDIPKNERVYKNFRIASVKTKSTEYPGFSVVLEWVDTSTGIENSTFDTIINSLSY